MNSSFRGLKSAGEPLYFFLARDDQEQGLSYTPNPQNISTVKEARAT
jgi:hypothetical protein